MASHRSKPKKPKILGYKYTEDGHKITVYEMIIDPPKRKIRMVERPIINFSDLDPAELSKL
jgi:hypothetical protein